MPRPIRAPRLVYCSNIDLFPSMRRLLRIPVLVRSVSGTVSIQSGADKHRQPHVCVRTDKAAMSIDLQGGSATPDAAY